MAVVVDTAVALEGPAPEAVADGAGADVTEADGAWAVAIEDMANIRAQGSGQTRIKVTSVVTTNEEALRVCDSKGR